MNDFGIGSLYFHGRDELYSGTREVLTMLSPHWHRVGIREHSPRSRELLEPAHVLRLFGTPDDTGCHRKTENGMGAQPRAEGEKRGAPTGSHREESPRLVQLATWLGGGQGWEHREAFCERLATGSLDNACSIAPHGRSL